MVCFAKLFFCTNNMLKVGLYNWFECKQLELPDFTTIVVVSTTSSEYGSLSPFVLKDDNGRIMDNIWQGSKLYPKVPHVTIERYKRVVWTWPEEIHIGSDGKITDAYWKWRNALMNNPYPVRYPVGKSARRACKYSVLKSKGDDKYEYLDYIEARKMIYIPVYTEMVRKTDAFIKLQQRHNNGENLLIMDTDGPHRKSINHYMKTYNVSNDFIRDDNTIDANVENLKILSNDPKHPFGHGFCIAAALGGFTKQL